MKYSLFDNQVDADTFAKEVEVACAGIPGPKVIKYAVYIRHLGKWAVSREVDPPIIRGETVDTIEPPPPVEDDRES